MGEYANYKGQSIKIGTCEDMYYLRADQRHLVKAEHGSVDPVRDAEELRFRFPFPNEDDIEPGAFEDYNKTVTVWGAKVPGGVEHGKVQFKADNGYLVSLPCPESEAEQPFTIHRNGFGGAVKLRQQRFYEGKLVIVCECGGCGRAWRYPTLEDAQPVVDFFISESVKRAYTDGTPNEFYTKIAARIIAGYEVQS